MISLGKRVPDVVGKLEQDDEGQEGLQVRCVDLDLQRSLLHPYLCWALWLGDGIGLGDDVNTKTGRQSLVAHGLGEWVG